MNRYIKKYEDSKVLSDIKQAPLTNSEWMKETLASLSEEDLKVRKSEALPPVLDPEALNVLYSVLHFLGEMEETF